MKPEQFDKIMELFNTLSTSLTSLGKEGLNLTLQAVVIAGWIELVKDIFIILVCVSVSFMCFRYMRTQCKKEDQDRIAELEITATMLGILFSIIAFMQTICDIPKDVFQVWYPQGYLILKVFDKFGISL